MKLYLITRNDFVEYDEYESCLVVADSPHQAEETANEYFQFDIGSAGWSDDVKVEHLGEAKLSYKEAEVLQAVFKGGQE